MERISITVPLLSEAHIAQYDGVHAAVCAMFADEPAYFAQ
jgi:hypothetical protein